MYASDPFNGEPGPPLTEEETERIREIMASPQRFYLEKPIPFEEKKIRKGLLSYQFPWEIE